MADVGDQTPNNRRIKPGDLRAECMRCGGSGRKMVTTVEHFPTIQSNHTVTRYAGPCVPCSGTGKVFPRKVDI